MRRELVHFASNRALELYLELSRWMQRAHVPRKLATPIDDAHTMAYVWISVGWQLKSRRHLDWARMRLHSVRARLERLCDEGFLTKSLLAWAQQQIATVIAAIDDWDPDRVELQIEPPPPLDPKRCVLN